MLSPSPPLQLTSCFVDLPPGRRLWGEHKDSTCAGGECSHHRGLAVAGEPAVQEGAYLWGQHHRPQLDPDGSALLQVSRLLDAWV